jgi:hypothetical protein
LKGVLLLASTINEKFKYVIQTNNKTEFKQVVDRLSGVHKNLTTDQKQKRQDLIDNAVKSLRKARYHF